MNKKIYKEAAYIFYSENLFVLVSVNHKRDLSYKRHLPSFFEQCRVPVLARNSLARDFQHHAMKVHFGHWIGESRDLSWSTATADQEQNSTMETEFIIAGDDLSLLCKSYVKFCPYSSDRGYETYLQASFIRLEVLEGRSQPPPSTLRAVHKPAIYERRLLEPFLRLHSQSSVHIEGVSSAEYKKAILVGMTKAIQTAGDLLHSINTAHYQADEHSLHGNLDLACATYETVIEDVELGFEWPPKSGRPFQCHTRRKDSCQKAVCFAELYVRNRLSEICLALQRPNQVLKWVNSALLKLPMHRSYTDADSLRKLQAELRYRFAWASHQLDVRCRALDSIATVSRLDPDNDFYKRVEQDWLEEEAQRPHEHGGTYAEACEGSLSWKLAQHHEDG